MKRVFIIPAAGLLAAPAAAAGVQEKVRERPRKGAPNVVYILADDLGYGDLGCMGQRKIRTPNIDRLAAEGMLFTQHYAGSAVSAPSRSVLLTGLHTGHTPIRGNKSVVRADCRGQQPLPEDTFTIARMFRTAGYATGIFGKWGLGYPGSEGVPAKQGFDEFFGYYCQALAHRYYPDHLWHDDERVVLDGNAGYARGEYSADLIHEKALEFIGGHAQRPFFLLMAYTLPHAELAAPEDEIMRYYRGRFPEKAFAPGGGNDYGPEMLPGGYASQQEPMTTYAAMVTRLDKYVGEVMAELRRLGIEGNTVVIFSSDNGPHNEGGAAPRFFDSAGPLHGIKRDLYEGGIRVPLVVRGPEIEAGSVSDHLCAFWDMLPTFADMVGVKLPASVRHDGISFYPTLTGKKRQPQHEYLYWEFHERNGSVAVRRENWKAVRRNAFTDKARTELYDLSADIHEDRDLAAERPEVVAELENCMREAHAESAVFPFLAKW